MSAKEIKALERRFWDDWNKGKAAYMAEIDKICATDVVFHGWFSMDYGLEVFKQNCNDNFNAFPDIHWTIDDMIVERDKIVVRYTMTGTHKGEFRGIPPTNKKVTIWGIDIHRFVGGKLVECWSRVDTMGFLQQFGLAPILGKGK